MSTEHIFSDPSVSSGWGDPGEGGNAESWAGWMSQHSAAFDVGVQDLKQKLSEAFDELKANPTAPETLAAYQSALAEYNMYRMLQSNSTKGLTDQSKAVIRNLA